MAILEIVWFFVSLPKKETSTHYEITKETPQTFDEKKNIFHETNTVFSFELPPDWTYTATSSIHSTSSIDTWNFTSENKQIAVLEYPIKEIKFSSCSKEKYLYLHQYKTNDPKTPVIGEICASCEETKENLGLCKVSNIPKRGFIYWNTGLPAKSESATNTTALFKFNFSSEEMDLNKAVDIVDQIAGSVEFFQNIPKQEGSL